MIDGGGSPPTVEGQGVPLTVIVVGAGVSGCACAAALASEGLRVTLMNSAMDRVGLPAYGPDLIGEDGGWRQAADALRGLPLPLRGVWLEAATMPASGEAVLNIDRRKISVETKRALECIPGLEFRQGFVTDVRLVTRGHASQEASENARTKSDGSVPGQARDRQAQGGQGAGQQAKGPNRRVQVETIFGEVFEADVVVVAVGLSLGGRINAGTDVVHGGRYGEPASEGLRTALQALGAEFRETALEVGPRASVRSATAQGSLTGADSRGSRENRGQSRAGGPCEEPLLPAAPEPTPDRWPAGYPPAPQWQADLRVDRMVMASSTIERGEARRLPALSPDGAATSEVYLRPGSVFVDEMAAVAGDKVGPIASRVPLTVTGLTVEGVSDTGRMWCGGEPRPVWVVGRSAGARDYAASLSSGVRAARDIAQSLGELAAARLAAEPSPISDEPGQGSGT